jgi:hypothetical protein
MLLLSVWARLMERRGIFHSPKQLGVGTVFGTEVLCGPISRISKREMSRIWIRKLRWKRRGD